VKKHWEGQPNPFGKLKYGGNKTTMIDKEKLVARKGYDKKITFKS